MPKDYFGNPTNYRIPPTTMEGKVLETYRCLISCRKKMPGMKLEDAFKHVTDLEQEEVWLKQTFKFKRGGDMVPTEVEIKNAQKVAQILSDLDIAFETQREDIFVVTEPESGLQIVVDVEETTVVLLMDVCPVASDAPALNGNAVALYKKLLEINNKSVHGSFAISGQRIILKDTLEFENLDSNELEASLTHMFIIAGKSLEEIDSLVHNVPLTA